MGRENSFIITKRLNEKLKDKFNFADKRYSLETRYDSYEEEIDVDLNFYEGDYSEDEIESLSISSCLYFNINPRDYNSLDAIVDYILIKSKEHIKNNFMDDESRYEIVDNLNKIMKVYDKMELLDKYEEVEEILDYELYIFENAIQCGVGNNFAVTVFRDKIYNLYTEKYIEYSNYEELNNKISNMLDSYILDFEEKIRNSEEEYDDYDESDYTRPQDYPDWDGDESLMYELDL